jgi:pimeloyl-ACP methyl ester carboxylesterase
MIRFTRLILLVLFYGLALVSCHQERMVFQPERLPVDYVFQYNQPFTEMYIPVDNNIKLNALLFKAEQSKGLVFYLHGNAGSLRTWGLNAEPYLQNHYDFFAVDYRGYGKSDGFVKNEKMLMHDVQIVYDSLKQFYDEDRIVIVGFSIGTGPATCLASENHPRYLILKAPYYSLADMVNHNWGIPRFLVKFQLKTFEFIPRVKCPITIFHGDSDEVIYTDQPLNSSLC